MLAHRMQQAAAAQVLTAGPILDQLAASAVAAYSLRKLTAGYSGSAIKVRRSSDGTTLDIGFDSSGNLDTASLLSFVSAGDGTIQTWYDQSGSALDATQATAANQPNIVSAGSLQTMGSVATAVFGGSQLLATAAQAVLASGSAVSTSSTVFQISGNTFVWGYGANSTDQGRQAGNTVGNQIVFSLIGDQINGPSNPAAPMVVTGDFGSALTGYLDGTSWGGSSYTMNTTASQPLYLGGNVTGSSNFNGKASEFIFFNATLTSSDRGALEHDQGSYYGITVT